MNFKKYILAKEKKTNLKMHFFEKKNMKLKNSISKHDNEIFNLNSGYMHTKNTIFDSSR
jgi:hypothetical protein